MRCPNFVRIRRGRWRTSCVWSHWLWLRRLSHHSPSSCCSASWLQSFRARPFGRRLACDRRSVLYCLLLLWSLFTWWCDCYAVRRVRVRCRAQANLRPVGRLFICIYTNCWRSGTEYFVYRFSVAATCCRSAVVRCLTLSVPRCFWLWQTWVYQSVQRHAGLTHRFKYFLTFGHSGAHSWAPECPNVKTLKGWVRPVVPWTLWSVTIWHHSAWNGMHKSLPAIWTTGTTGSSLFTEQARSHALKQQNEKPCLKTIKCLSVPGAKHVDVTQTVTNSRDDV